MFVDGHFLLHPPFAESVISGVSFAGVPGTLWHTEVSPLAPEGDGAPRGQVTVEGIAADGTFVEGALEELTWSLQ
jgi:hypothetical protein